MSPWFAAGFPHLVTQRHHAALIPFDLRQMEGDISVELFEEGDSVADQDRQDRITNFVGEPETEALARNHTSSYEPNIIECGPQAPIHELLEVPRVKDDSIPGTR
jgi:hypothetical protein